MPRFVFSSRCPARSPRTPEAGAWRPRLGGRSATQDPWREWAPWNSWPGTRPRGQKRGGGSTKPRHLPQ
eukprot:5294834-Alexandrium_andersonii.AAC.1